MLKFILSFASGVLLLFNPGFSQDQRQDVKKKVNEYLQYYAIRDLQVNFNQPIYSPGDSAFFVVGSPQLMSFDRSRELLTICILDGSGKNVMMQKIMLQRGIAKNQLVFPADMQPGLYRWVILADRFRMERQSLLDGTLNIVGKKKIISENTLIVSIEGNSFINGLECVLHVQLRDGGTNQKVKISNNEGGLVSTGISDSSGQVEISFVPEESVQSYEVSIENVPGSAIQLPSRQNTGWTLREEKSGTDESRHIKISSRASKDEKVSLVFCSRHEVLSVSTVSSNQKEQIVKVPTHFENISHILLVDDSLHVRAQLALLKCSANKKKIEIQLPHSEFYTRDSVHLKLRGLQEMKWMVVRVLKKDLFSELNKPLNTIRHTEIDQEPFFSSQLELKGDQKSKSYQEIQGAIRMEKEIRSLDSTQVMLFLQKSIFGYEAFVDKSGHFKIPLVFTTEGTEPAFYSVKTKYGDIINPVLDFEKDEYTFRFFDQKGRESEEADRYGEYIYTKRVIEESFSSHKNDSKVSDNPNQKYEEELGGADIVRKLDDYTPFGSIEDVIREVVPAVEYRKKGDRNVVRVFTSEKRPKDGFGPLYIIDGIFFKNPSFFLNLPIADVKIIKVVKDSRKLRAFGTLGENGIILVETRSGKTLAPESLTLVRGVSPLLPSRVYSGQSTKNQRTPDLRSCLFWCPIVKLDSKNEAELSFMTSDDLGEMIIQVEGETTTGEYILEERTFVVSFSNKKS